MRPGTAEKQGCAKGTTGITPAAIAAVLLAVVLCLPSLANAGDDEGIDLGNAGGMNYRVSISEDFAGIGLNSFVACLAGDRAIAGGIDLAGSATASRMGGTYPTQEGGPWLWRTAGYNLGGGTMDMSFFAICREADPALLKSRSATLPFNPNTKRTVKVACPDGFRAIAGPAGTVRLHESHPIDFGGPEDTPEDGWRVSLSNGGVGSAEGVAQTICRV